MLNPPNPGELARNASPPSSGGVLAGYLNEADAAAECGLMPRTFRKYREQGTGPAYAVIGRRVFYSRDAIRDWIVSKTVKPVRSRRG